MPEQIIDTIASDTLQHISQIDLVPHLRVEVSDGIERGLTPEATRLLASALASTGPR